MLVRPKTILTFCAGLTIILYAMESMKPVGWNWGFHLLGFFPIPFRVAVVLCMSIALIPRVQNQALLFLGRSVKTHSHQPRRIKITLYIVAMLMFGSLLYIFRTQTTFLGDSFLLSHYIPTIRNVSEIPNPLNHEPFTMFIVWHVFNMLNALSPGAMGETAFFIVSSICGILIIPSSIALAQLISNNSIDRVLVVLFLLVYGGSQLLFGYIEFYSPTYLVLLLFILSALLMLRDRVSLLLPSFLFGVLFPLYFGTVIFLPALVFLYIRTLRLRKISTVIFSLIVLVGTVLILLWISGHAFSTALEFFTSGQRHIVPFIELQEEWQGYTMISFAHLLDLINAVHLIAPFSVCMLMILFCTVRKIFIIDQEWLLLLLVGSASAGVWVTFNCDIGMSRDWDLFATLGFGCIIALIYGWFRFLPDRRVRRSMLLIIIIVSGLQTATLVALNSDEGRALVRFKRLPTPLLWGKKAFKVYEELAIYYREQRKPNEAIECYRQYLRFDSTNVRIWENLAQLAVQTRNDSEAIFALRGAIARATKTHKPYISLAAVFTQHRQYDEAITVLLQGIDRFPDIANIHIELGKLYLQRNNDCHAALPQFLNALAIDSKAIEAYFYAGECCYKNHDFINARRYWQAYIESSPNDSAASYMRDLLRKIH